MMDLEQIMLFNNVAMGLIALKFMLIIITLASLSIFYARWKFVKKNYSLYLGINFLGLSFLLDYATMVRFFDAPVGILLSNLSQAMFCLALASSYYNMMRITEKGKEEKKTEETPKPSVPAQTQSPPTQ